MKEGALPMPSDVQSRWQYLELARFCQRVISALSYYLDGAKLPVAILEETREALRSVQEGDPFRFGGRSAEALGSYEQLRTLEEAWKAAQLEEAVRLTTELLADGEAGAKADKAEQVINLFSKLQVKALWNFEQPKRTAPPDTGELCKALNTA